jgi:hypothetical protein
VIDQLFGSKTRVKLLQLFYGNPNRSFYVREITRKIDEQINSVRRELSNLLSIGIIKSETTNNRLYYEVNQEYELYRPLAEIFGGATVSVATPGSEEEVDPVTASLKPLGHIDLALYTGQFTRDERSGVDFLLVGDINQTQLNKYVSDLEAREGKEIRYTVMSRKEFEYRMQINDRFLLTVLESKYQLLVDKGLLAQTEKVAAEEAEEPKAKVKKGK